MLCFTTSKTLLLILFLHFKGQNYISLELNFTLVVISDPIK